MRRDPSRKQTSVQNRLDDARYESRTIQLRHLLGNRDVRVDHGIVVDEHVLVLVVPRLLQPVGGLVEYGAVDRCRYKLQDPKDACFALCTAPVAPEEELQEALADRVSVKIEPGGSLLVRDLSKWEGKILFFEVGDAVDTFLGVLDHLSE